MLGIVHISEMLALINLTSQITSLSINKRLPTCRTDYGYHPLIHQPNETKNSTDSANGIIEEDEADQLYCSWVFPSNRLINISHFFMKSITIDETESAIQINKCASLTLIVSGQAFKAYPINIKPYLESCLSKEDKWNMYNLSQKIDTLHPSCLRSVHVY